MRAKECLPDGWIGDNDVRYTAQVAGYTTLMSDINELVAIAFWRIKNGDHRIFRKRTA